jgi:two-component system, response regulator PdtaR
VEEPSGEPVSLSDRRTVLVVEDEVLIRFTIAQDLMDAGFHVIQAASGVEALQLLRTSVEVDLVSTDINMPGGVDGIELARQLRALRPHAKIVFVSSTAKLSDLDGLADLCFDKPYHVSDLVAGIQQLLGIEDHGEST